LSRLAVKIPTCKALDIRKKRQGDFVKDRSDRLGTIALIAYMLCACVCLCAIFLTTLGLNDNVYRLIHELLTDHRTASCSFLLYVTLNAALIVRAWAAYKNHHNIRWFNFVNIGLATGMYGACAYLLSVYGHSILMDAALNPLFWMIDNIRAVLLYTVVVIGICYIAYCVTRYLALPSALLLLRKRRIKNEINPFKQELKALEDPMQDPAFHETYQAIQQERGTDNT
jgi:hypothetical protein